MESFNFKHIAVVLLHHFQFVGLHYVMLCDMFAEVQFSSGVVLICARYLRINELLPWILRDAVDIVAVVR